MLTLEQAKKSMELEIEKAKKLIENMVGEVTKWVEATLPILGKEEHAVRVFVLEGAPPKGYIIADYTLGYVKAFRKIDIRNVKTFRAYKKGECLGVEKFKDEDEFGSK